MKALVSCVRHRGRYLTCSLVEASDDGISMHEVKSDIVLEAGDVISTDDADTIITAVILEGEQKESALDPINFSIAERIKALVSKSAYKKGDKRIDKATERMWDSLNGAAPLFLRKLLLGVPIIVRFHNDADGSSGAYSLYKASEALANDSNTLWIMHKGTTYNSEDATNDILLMNGYSAIEKPLLVVIDFGTSPESNKGIDAISDRFDTVWMDHHPLQEGFESSRLTHYINPWAFGGDSNYTAGLLASVFTHTFSDIDTGDAEAASLIGDYSDFAEKNEKGSRLATLLDLLTSDSKLISGYLKKSITPSEIDAVLSDTKKVDEIVNYANARLAEALDNGIASAKEYTIERLDIYLLDFEGIRNEDSKYPLPGRFSTKFLDKLKEGRSGGCVAIVHAGTYISIRISKDVCPDVNLLQIIKELKENNPGRIENGGGHNCAASIKVFDKLDKKEVIKQLVERLKE